MNEITYKEAFAELQEIVKSLEIGEIEIDELSEKVKRAGFLIKLCKGKLISVEDDVKSVLKELESIGE